MIDTHSHVKPLSASPNLPLTLPNGGQAGATQMEDQLDFVVLSGSTIADSKKNIEESKKNIKILAAVGIHPQEKLSVDSHELRVLEDLLIQNKNIVAVGECGMDFSNPSALQAPPLDRGGQELLFRGQIELAIKYDKALIVHSRKAAEETLEILKKYKNLRGVIHCYTGGKKRIKQYLEISDNWYFGIDGNLTYEDGLVEVVKNIPKDRLVLETDSPYLTPVPHRGEENRPEYVKFVYQKVAEIWGMSFEETEKIIDENARRLFII